MQDEYISKKQAINCIASNYCIDCEHSNGILCRACDHQDDMDIIDSMPAADVKINKRGKWVTDGKTHKRCSSCKNFLASNTNVLLYKYCPQCGAEMINS